MLAAVAPAQAADSDWAANFYVKGANGTVSAMVETTDAIYIGGDFTAVGNVAANRVARFNKASGIWSAMGSGMDGQVVALAIIGTDVYAGGLFYTAGGTFSQGIAKWNGTAWSTLGSGINGSVYSLTVSGTDLYVGGDFTIAGGTTANRIAKWNGTAWSALGTGTGNTVRAILVSGTDIYAGGYFTSAGGVPANYVAKWNGTAWSALGTGANSTVFSLAKSGSDLYMSGTFNSAGGVTANCIAKWNGTIWSALGTGMNGIVTSMVVSGTELYAGGGFTTAGGAAANRVAKWNGTTWSPLGSGLNSTVNALTMVGTDLYSAGNFTTAGGLNAKSFAKWNGTTWSDLGNLANGDGLLDNGVTDIVSSGNLVYVTGGFTAAGGVPANNVACWNTQTRTWSALGSGLNGSGECLVLVGTDLYVGGGFSSAGGVAAVNIAKWNGTTWSALGTGANSTVSALAANGTDVYAGGYFTSIGGVTANYIAKWNGTTWSALGAGANNSVAALLLNGGDIYAGGDFTTAGGVAASYIAKWNGTTWSPLGSGVNGSVTALSGNGTELYASGFFTTAGGVSARSIAKWNGTTWSALGTGLNTGAYSLAMDGTNLYAGGFFTTAGGVSANFIAKWNGTAWSGLGSGTNNAVYALAVSARELYAGGAFDMAGGKVSSYIGAYDLVTSAPPTAGVNLSSNAPTTNQTLTATASATPVRAGQTYAFTWTRKVGAAAAVTVKTTTGNTTGTDSLNLATPGLGDKGDVITVSVTVNDSVGTSTPATATATVANSAPSMKPIELSTWANRNFLGRPEFSDPDGDAVVIFAVTPISASGSITEFTPSQQNPDGLYLYTARSTPGTDTFLFTVTDGAGSSNQTATITVGSAPAAGTPLYTAIGASDAQGFGASDYVMAKTTISPANSYAPKVAANDKLGGVFPGLVLSRRAINGLTLAGANRALGGQSNLSLAIADGARAYSVWYGPNDILLELLPILVANANNPVNFETARATYLSNWKNGYTALAGALQGANPTAKIAAITVPDLGPSLAAAAVARYGLPPAAQAPLAAALTDSCAQMSAHIRATFPASLDIVGNQDLVGLPPAQAEALYFRPATDLFTDGYHPNNSGYAKIATRLFRLVNNTAPTASAQNVTLEQNQATTIALGGSDPENDTLQFKILTLPANGALHLGTSSAGQLITAAQLPYLLPYGNQVTFVPTTNISGNDSFNFKVSDGKVDSANTATVALTVNAVTGGSVDVQASGQVTVTRATQSRQRTGRYTQQITIKNVSAANINGPLILTVDGLPGTATLYNSDGTTTVAPLSPYKTIPLTNGVLTPGSSVIISLEFTTSVNPPINYTTRVLQGGPF